METPQCPSELGLRVAWKLPYNHTAICGIQIIGVQARVPAAPFVAIDGGMLGSLIVII